MNGTLTRLHAGYTVVELLIVLALLSVLASIALPMVELNLQRERERELKRALWEIRDAIDAYREARAQGAIPGAIGSSLYPPSLAVLTQAVRDARPQRQSEVLRFLRRVPRDPFADPGLPAEQTWGLRSYRSEADRPEPGEDVFDVFSRSARIALNGMPLRQF
jgi:general secretion pathway protein G